MVGKSVITLDDLSIRQIQELLHKAQYIDSHRKEVAHTCEGRVLATLFYEPSTRTRLSFETAMLRLGGKVIGFAGAQLASVTKGETIADTLKTVSNYVDVVAIRHPKEGAALVASRAASVPVINAGDGGHMHPTQTLADLATLQSRFGRITNLTVGLCGDLTFGRTVHSLIETLCRFGNVNFVLISPDELKTPRYVLDRIDATESCSYTEVKDLASVIGDLDVLYMTRVQKERFFNEDDYLRLRDTYILDEAKMSLAKKDMAVLHPLRLTVTNYPEGQTEIFEVENHPNHPEMGKREIPFSRDLWIEQDDFMEEKVGKFFRLFPGNEVRLKGAYVVKCTGCVKDADGNVTEVLCEYDPASRGGDPADGRKVKSTIHWVEANEAVDAEVRLYSNLFTDPDPDAADKDFLECLNPDSLEILTGCKIERALAAAKAPESYQFMRLGYFCPDSKDSTPEHPVFNRSVSLKDSYKPQA